MKKKHLIIGGAIGVLMNLAVILAVASSPTEEYGVNFSSSSCYQTMGYCDGTLTYKCTKFATSEYCRIYFCKDCGPSTPVDPIGIE